MWIREARFRQFRNYEELRLDLDAHKNLFLGDNAAGKSNILEAIYTLSHGKSHRTRHERELIRWEQPFASVHLDAQSHRHGGTITLEAQWTLTPEGTLKTLFKQNGNAVRSRSEIVGKIPTVTFFLPDLLMLRGAPEDRRSAVDACLVQCGPVHFKRLAAYNRVRQQKSQLLRQGQGGYGVDTQLLASLDDQLAQTGADLMAARMGYLQQAETLAQLRYHELSQGRDRLTLMYQPSFTEEEPVTADIAQLRDRLSRVIAQRSTEEQRRGQVLVGPHRDDVRFFLDDRDASLYGSQGQQRSIVLAMKLAEIDLLTRAQQGEMPVLLLDDVMAELDPTRQRQLLAHLDPAMQVCLTTTHLDSGVELFLDGTASARVFAVTPGRVEVTQSQPAQPQTVEETPIHGI